MNRLWILGVMLFTIATLSAQGLQQPNSSDWYFRDYAPQSAAPDYLQLPQLRIKSNRTLQTELPATMPVITPGSDGYLQVMPPDSTRKYYLRIEGAPALPAPNTKE